MIYDNTKPDLNLEQLNASLFQNIGNEERICTFSRHFPNLSIYHVDPETLCATIQKGVK